MLCTLGISKVCQMPSGSSLLDPWNLSHRHLLHGHTNVDTSNTGKSPRWKSNTPSKSQRCQLQASGSSGARRQIHRLAAGMATYSNDHGWTSWTPAGKPQAEIGNGSSQTSGIDVRMTVRTDAICTRIWRLIQPIGSEEQWQCTFISVVLLELRCLANGVLELTADTFLGHYQS